MAKAKEPRHWHLWRLQQLLEPSTCPAGCQECVPGCPSRSSKLGHAATICKQQGHWSRECPQGASSMRGLVQERVFAPGQGGGPTAAMFFVSPTAENASDGAHDPGGSTEVETYMTECVDHCGHVDQPHASMTTSESYLTYTYATVMETAGNRPSQTQRHNLGCLVGRRWRSGMTTCQSSMGFGCNTLARKVEPCMEFAGRNRKLRSPMCQIGISGCSDFLRVQIVLGPVPCLLPAYLLTNLGSVIDMASANLYHTGIGVVQQMFRSMTGHVDGVW